MLYAERLLNLPPDMLIIDKSTCFGIIKTIAAIIFSYAIGWLLNKYFPLFFGYKKTDPILQKLQNKYPSK